MADVRPFIKVDHGMPDHPKIYPLSDRAFRLMVETWCWCSRNLTDGRIPGGAWRKRATPKARKELTDAGLIEELPGGDFQAHDYLGWQRSATEVAEAKAAKSKGGTVGNHVRWHVDAGIVKEDCEHCPKPPRDDTEPPDTEREPISEGSQKRSDNRSQTDRFGSPTIDTEGSPTGIPSGSAGRHPADRYAGAREDDEDQLDKTVADLLRQHTARPIDHTWAAKVRTQILAGRHPKYPEAYLAAAIREDPDRYLPAARDPSSRTPAEAIRDSLGEAPQPQAAPSDDIADLITKTRLSLAKKRAPDAP